MLHSMPTRLRRRRVWRRSIAGNSGRSAVASPSCNGQVSWAFVHASLSLTSLLRNCRMLTCCQCCIRDARTCLYNPGCEGMSAFFWQRGVLLTCFSDSTLIDTSQAKTYRPLIDYIGACINCGSLKLPALCSSFLGYSAYSEAFPSNSFFPTRFSSSSW
jgi:hypothetical protein